MAVSEETVQRHRWTVAEIHRFIERGAFRPEDRLELIEGELIDMAPIGPEHAECVDELNERFTVQAQRRFRVRVQNPITLSDASEPQPDIALVRRQPALQGQHPSPEDVLLLIEVSDTTGDYDHNVKLPLYARSGISEVWLIDLRQRAIEVYRNPKDDQYTDTVIYSQGEVSAQWVSVAVYVEDLFSSIGNGRDRK
jgi:Uma2 family endonuclease